MVFEELAVTEYNLQETLKRVARERHFKDNYAGYVKDCGLWLRQAMERDLPDQPRFAVTLGSGLGDLADEIDKKGSIAYEHIPYGFPKCSVEGHEGQMIFGYLEGVPIIGLQGRTHFYEVADEANGLLKIVFPINVMAELGVENYFVTNASGGLNLGYEVGDIMIIKSHINMIPNALLGKKRELKRVDGTDTWRFQPMNGAYDPVLRSMLRTSADAHNVTAHEGTHLAVTGPTYETEGECQAFRALGADTVGMSTTPEVIVARNRGMKCVGFSCITNKIAEDGTNATNHEEVKRILGSKKVRKGLANTVRGFFRNYASKS